MSTTDQEPPVIRLADGKVKKQILKQGTGEVAPNGCEISVHYTGRLMNGTKFDSSLDRKQPFSFKLGGGQVIKGWDEGVSTMRKGERAKLIIESDYAYGMQGSPPTIPPNATLQFEIEVLGWEDRESVTEDRNIMKKLIRKGNGYLKPNDGAKCTIKYTARIKDGPVIEDFSDKEYVHYLGEDPDKPYCFDEILRNMLSDEHSYFYVKPIYAYGETGNEALGISPNTHLEYDLHLLSFEKAKETWEMNNDQKVELMNHLKDIGNTFFKKGNTRRAADKYSKGAKIFQYDRVLEDEHKQKVNDTRSVLYSNWVQCNLKLNQHQEAIDNATEGLKINPKHIKTLYRRAQAYINLGKYEEAFSDIKTALEIEPNNEDVKKLYDKAHNKIQSMKDKEKKTFGKMFDKIKAGEESIY